MKMMNLKSWSLLLAAPLLTACVNSDYDLSDIDTTVDVPVKDLVVPLNLDAFSLGTVLHVEDNKNLEELNGEYAVVFPGEFESAEFQIEPITAPAPSIAPIKGTMSKHTPETYPLNKKSSARRAAATDKLVAWYDMPKEVTPITITSDQVHDAINRLDDLSVDTELSVTIDIDKSNKLKDLIDNVRVEGFEFQLPRGVEGELKIIVGDVTYPVDAYDPETGIVSFAKESIVVPKGEFTLWMHITGISRHALEDVLKRANPDDEKLTLTINENYGIIDGYLAIYTSGETAVQRRARVTAANLFELLPESLEYHSGAVMEDIVINKFSGDIDYAIDDYRAEGISLRELPDMLRESGTHLGLTNPQIYLHVINPVADGEGRVITAHSQIGMTAYDANHTVQGKYDMGLNGSIDAGARDNYFLLAPHNVPAEQRYPGYEDAVYIEYKSLSDVLGGASKGGTTLDADDAANGHMPETIDVELRSTRIKGHNVVDYDLDQLLQLEGEYIFVAPLALTEHSTIRYAENVDGWADSLEDLSLEHLTVSASVSTDVPFALEFRITPIDIEGNKMAGEFSAAHIPANAKNAPLELNIAARDLKGIDGIRVEALAVSEAENALRPGMNIDIKDLKVKVSGHYVSK